ncbi:MAG: histidinol dehydrogenase [Rickettsiales bacterium]|nr:histidinol dehydrogenase [Rickettsiales bacterium]
MKKFIIKNKISKNLDDLKNEDFVTFITESNHTNQRVTADTINIIEDVKEHGDEALIKYANTFDKTNFNKPSDLLVTTAEISKACKNLDKEVKKSLDLAYRRIKDYHKKQLPSDLTYTDKAGVTLGNIWKNIEKIGIYTPGGTASYPSSVLMSTVPAITAGVKDIVMCAPTSQGKINPAVLYAAKLCGIKEIYKIGGAGAIAALTYSTKTVKKVNKIVGPGNAYVAEAKRILFGEVGIDMIAGPTDITIITDKYSNPKWIAADALSQLEHGPDSKAFIITDNEKIADEIINNIQQLSKNLSRKEIIAKSIKNSAIFIINNLNDASKIANFIAPEHLEIATKSPEKFVKKIQNAGAIFLGNYAPESLGDYIAGPSHTLPTNASAKFSSGLSVYDFLKRISVISTNEQSFKKLAKQTSTLAKCEGLDAHKLSIDIRND